MEPVILWQKLHQMETKRLILAMGIVVCLIIVFQSSFLAPRNVLYSLIPGISFPVFRQNTSSNGEALTKFAVITEESFLDDSESKIETPVMVGSFKRKEDSEKDIVLKEKVGASEDGFTADKARYLGNGSLTEKSGSAVFGQNTSSNGEGLTKFPTITEEPFLKDSESKVEAPVMVQTFKQKEDSEGDFALTETKEKVGDSEDGFTIDKARCLGNDSLTEGSGSASNNAKFPTITEEPFLKDSESKVEAPVMVQRFKQKEDSEGDFALTETKEKVGDSEDGFTIDKARCLGNDSLTEGSGSASNNATNMTAVFHLIDGTSSLGQEAMKSIFKDITTGPCRNVSPILNDTLILKSFPLLRKKGWLPRKKISEMSDILLQNHVSSHAMEPRWPLLACDHELLSAKLQIENAPFAINDRHLYAPLFRNVSMFRRSYELMERLLKVYVYKDGEKPIFHKPKLTGVYGSEGWFMKLMESNKHFVVKNPRKAHLFYLPFSSRTLRFNFADRGLNRRYMAAYLRQYVDLVAAKFPFWNRTGGADHFLAACHDWAPYLTRNKLESSIRVLCNADLAEGFKLGKDASLPVTFVRNLSDPLNDLGGLPAKQRSTLAFFSGSRHGPLREILLTYWENKDPSMKIFGPTTGGRMNETDYVGEMKKSRYCICPRGYGVHSPRVVEAILYECVPVIISDNYVPPFFEILNWEALAVFVAEADIPKLKDILLSIAEEEYLTMQMGVQKVQQHFLWHADPIRYDVFHMILHSVWFNRLNQIRTQ